MKYAVCILAHQKPALLDRIVKKVTNDNVEVYVHLDSKCRLSDYSYIQDALFIPKRVNVSWGGRSMIVAMRNLIEYVVTFTKCDYILFISGEDYPLVYPEKYNEYIECSKNYIEYKKLPRNDWHLGGINRINRYFMFDSYTSELSRLLLKMQKILHITRDFQKFGFECYGGSQWININRMAAEYILTNWNKYYNFYKYTHIPDEMIFQTILLNSPMKESIINTNLRYIQFEANQRNPVYLDESHYTGIKNMKALFCRKIKDEASFDKIAAFFSKMKE